jgi:inositol phosphorylceramide mannosyltransferase catalytic subunit
MISKIPKRIIQTNKSLDLSLLEKAAVANIRLLNPDFEYVFFDDKQVEEFIDKEFPEYRSVFDSFPIPIQRYDFFRYLAVYRLGGFYLDMDVFLASNLSELLNYDCVFPFEALTINVCLREDHNMDWEIGNYGFGASAGHPFLRAVIENCVKAQQDLAWVQTMARSVPRLFVDEYRVLYTTGPLLVSRTLAMFPDAAKHVKVLFPEDVCDSKYWNQFGKFGVHLRGGSWRKPNGILRRRFQGYWELHLLNKFLKESRKLGKGRSLQFK